MKLINGELCELVQYTSCCSGCTELLDGQNVYGYPTDKKARCLIGSGCHECGYTGKRRHRIWIPVGPTPTSRESSEKEDGK